MDTSLIIVEVAPYWNVNEAEINDYKYTYKVEVAPYWNVNRYVTAGLKQGKLVEVAPYWNVNVKESSSILECKSM